MDRPIPVKKSPFYMIAFLHLLPIGATLFADATAYPGNIFTEGEMVTIAIPELPGRPPFSWTLFDDAKTRQSGGTVKQDCKMVQAGKLGTGWYRVEFKDSRNNLVGWTTAAVITPLKVPTPQDSPICIDGAIAWFAHGNRKDQTAYARLARLAGVSWIRDRLKWREIQPDPTTFAENNTTYDLSADIQHQQGLKIHQVFHDTPEWATEKGESRGRFVRDLRILFRFCKAMGKRYGHRVHAWEPWNEANVPTFGGHTVDEMCTFQKAAYLGFKAGAPDVIVCSNAYTAVPTELHTQGVLKNETWSYFDTYNIHTYDSPLSYERLWAPVREAASGRPIWVTESDRGMKAETGAPWFDLPRHGEIQKAHFMAQSYASSLLAGADRHFHFILGHYHESNNQVQFGLLRKDFTPRPSYVALAAIGRFLAGAKCLGRWLLPGSPEVHVIAFRAQPDGKNRDVLVAWSENQDPWEKRDKLASPWQLPETIKPAAVYDYLGRPIKTGVPAMLTGAPIFVLLPPGSAEKLALSSPKPKSAYRPGTPCPVVLQLSMPRNTAVQIKKIPWAIEFEHTIPAGKPTKLQFYAYNFSPQKATGRLVFKHIPAGWQVTPSAWPVEIPPMNRIPLTAMVTKPLANKQAGSKQTAEIDNWLILRGNFNNSGKSVLAFRLISEAGEAYPE